jgi:hypothetical protein
MIVSYVKLSDVLKIEHSNRKKKVNDRYREIQGGLYNMSEGNMEHEQKRDGQEEGRGR